VNVFNFAIATLKSAIALFIDFANASENLSGLSQSRHTTGFSGVCLDFQKS